ncbi:hypothetical protein CH289_07630 [Rhodococcus sp. RS1C4]|nr:hypothetical protein CH289_07630 [Rhodococcus sp. RS1C4]
MALNGTPTGMLGSPFTHIYQTNARTKGRIWKGKTDESGTITADLLVQPWRLDVRRSTESFWRSYHSRWRASLGRGDEVGRWLVRSSESGHWWADCRLGEVAETDDYRTKPGLLGVASEKLTLLADYSFWQGPKESRTFDIQDLSTAKIQNRGDQSPWPVWEFVGPGQWTFGIKGGPTMTLPNMGNGQRIVVDTNIEDPLVRSGSLSGPSLWSQMGLQWVDGQQIPARRTGQSGLVDLQLSCVGGINKRSTATVSFTPITERAW